MARTLALNLLIFGELFYLFSLVVAAEKAIRFRRQLRNSNCIGMGPKVSDRFGRQFLIRISAFFSLPVFSFRFLLVGR